MIFHGGNGFRSRRFIQFAYIKLSYIIAIFFPSLADSKRVFLALPCRESIRRLSASASWESHPRALARALSCKYHHSSRLSSPAKGALYPSGRTFSFLWLADLSAAEVLYRINWYSIVKDQSCATGSPKGIAGYATLQRLSDMVKTAF